MAEKKSTLTLSDLLSRGAPTGSSPAKDNSPVGDREAIEKRTRFMREKTGTKDQNEPAVDKAGSITETSDEERATTVNRAELNQITNKQPLSTKTKSTPKATSKSNDDKITRSIQFSRATYRQMEKTLNYIAYKSGRRNVSFPKYFEKLHEIARQSPDLMNQLIDHFKTDFPD